MLLSAVIAQVKKVHTCSPNEKLQQVVEKLFAQA